MNKKLLVAAIAAPALLIGGLGMTSIYATGSTSSTFATRLAEKLGLSEEVVSQAIEETRTEELEDRLNTAVEDGRITENQKSLILEKRKEIETKLKEIEALDDDTLKEEAIASLKEELEIWTEENDIPTGYLNVKGLNGHKRKANGLGAEGNCIRRSSEISEE